MVKVRTKADRLNEMPTAMTKTPQTREFIEHVDCQIERHELRSQ